MTVQKLARGTISQNAMTVPHQGTRTVKMCECDEEEYTFPGVLSYHSR